MWYKFEYYVPVDDDGYIIDHVVEDMDFDSDEEVTEYIEYLRGHQCIGITFHCVSE